MRTQTEVYPITPQIFESDKAAINAWFDFRYVCDNEKFVAFFQRQLVKSYGRYRELLRIEPGISSYDWLVQQYKESQTYSHDIDERTANGTSSLNSNGEVLGNRTETGTSSETGTGSENTTNTGTTNDSFTNTNITINSGEDTTFVNGSATSNTENSLNTGGKDTVKDTGHTNVKGLERNAPMSVSYSGNGAEIDKKSGNTGALEWKYLTGQTEQDTRNDNNSETSYGRTETGNTDSSTSEQSKTELIHGHNVSGTDTHTGNGTKYDTGIKTTSDNRSGNNTVNAQTRDETTRTDTTEHGEKSQTDRQALHQHIDTGRSVDTATLLSQAQSFIMNSSAFEWLEKQLETCFLGIYEDDCADYNF